MAYFQPSFADLPGSPIIANFQTSAVLNGLDIRHVSTTVLAVSAGAARAYATNTVISFPSSLPRLNYEAQINTATLGALGCWPELPATAAPTLDTAFPIYLLGDDSGKNAPTLIVATGNDFLLDGYNVWRRIGQAHFDAGTNNMKFNVVTGLGSERHYQYLDTLSLVSAGNATTNTLVDLSATDFPCDPKFVTRLDLQIKFTPATAATNTFEVVTSTAPITSNPPLIVKSVADGVQYVGNVSLVPDVNSGATAFYYKVSNAADAVDIRLVGYTESLGIQAP